MTDLAIFDKFSCKCSTNSLKLTTFSVYAVLFCNVCFSFTTTCINSLSAIILPTFKLWCSVSAPLNFFSQLFHLVSWTVVSVLRYLYIVKADWLHQRFPDPSKLKVSIFRMSTVRYQFYTHQSGTKYQITICSKIFQ